MKNIILLITDTFRYDNLFARAVRPVRTPELDGFATTRATEVSGMYAGSFPTIPQRTDLAQGRLVWPHYPWQNIHGSGQNHIARQLGQAGYSTQLLCDCPHLFNYGFQYGFDAYFQTRGQESDVPLLHLNDPIQTVMPGEKTRFDFHLFQGHPLVDMHRWVNRYYTCEEETFCAKTSRLAVRWLEENYLANPFFLWVDFFDPHEPWDAPEYMVRRYDPEYSDTPMLHPNYGPADAYTPAELHNLWAHYAAEAELVDRMLGRVLQKIDDLELWKNSIVVVTSDHGFSIGEHDRQGKANLCARDERYWPLYPEIGHVPFLIAGSGIPRGKQLDLLAQPIDIMPTLCELAGAAINPPDPLEGESFAAPLLAGSGEHRDIAVTGCFVPAGDAVPAKSSTPFVVAEKWGYAPVGPDGQPELFELTSDPLATVNVITAHPQVAADLHQRFLDHLRRHGTAEEIVRMWK